MHGRGAEDVTVRVGMSNEEVKKVCQAYHEIADGVLKSNPALRHLNVPRVCVLLARLLNSLSRPERMRDRGEWCVVGGGNFALSIAHKHCKCVIKDLGADVAFCCFYI